VNSAIDSPLALSLLALELAAPGRSIRLIESGEGDTATALSHGLIPLGDGPWRSP